MSLTALADAQVAAAEKISYKQYEARELPNLKEENAGLKGSQPKELCWKNWN